MSYSLPELVKDYVSGKIELVDQTTYHNRLNICSKCENHKKICGQLICGKCGCVLAEKAKHVKSACPLDKWE